METITGTKSTVTLLKKFSAKKYSFSTVTAFSCAFSSTVNKSLHSISLFYILKEFMGGGGGGIYICCWVVHSHDTYSRAEANITCIFNMTNCSITTNIFLLNCKLLGFLHPTLVFFFFFSHGANILVVNIIPVRKRVNSQLLLSVHFSLLNILTKFIKFLDSLFIQLFNLKMQTVFFFS